MVEVVLENLSKNFGETKALSQVNLVIPDGSLTSCLGPSGCGKTTLLKLIAGLLKPDSGSVIFDGADITHLPPQKRHVGYVPQNLALFPHLSVTENVAFGLKSRNWPRNETVNRTQELLQLAEISHLADSSPHEISGGQQQRVALLRALAPKPNILLLDEPLSSLDSSLREHMQFEVKRIQREEGTTTVFVTHSQEEALAISDRLTILFEGKIIQEGIPEDVSMHPRGFQTAVILGKPNVLQVVSWDWSSDPPIVETPLGQLIVDESSKKVDSDGIQLLPNQLSLTKPQSVISGDTSSLEGIIVWKGAENSQITFFVKIKSLDRDTYVKIISEPNLSSEFHLFDPVRVLIPPESIIPFK